MCGWRDRATRRTFGAWFALSSHREPSTRAGRKYARLNEGDEVVLVAYVKDKDAVLVAVSDGHALGVTVSEISVLGGAGKGSMLVKVEEGERVVGAIIAIMKRDVITVETEKGKILELSWQGIEGSRADKGSAIVKRDRFARVVLPPPSLPSLEQN